METIGTSLVGVAGTVVGLPLTVIGLRTTGKNVVAVFM
jgi:hypothetical protein